MRSFRQLSSHVTKCHACHAICTLSPLDAALTIKNTQHHASKVLSLPRKMDSSSETLQKYGACNTKRPSTLYQTRENAQSAMLARQNGILTSENRDETCWNCWKPKKNAFCSRFPFTPGTAPKLTFSYEFSRTPNLATSKIDASRSASLNFRHK